MLKTAKHPDRSRTVGEFEIELMENTRVRFEDGKKVFGHDGKAVSDIEAGFEHEGTFYRSRVGLATRSTPIR